MVAFSFNAQQHSPQYGGGGGGLPAGPNGEDVIYDVIISGSQPIDTKDTFGNTTGGYLAFELASIAGPTQGTKHTDRLNVMHRKPDVAEIANKQLSAYCHVLGKFQFNDTSELHNIPFKVKIGLQKGEEARSKGYTEVKAVYDANGNEPAKAGSGPQPGANQQQGGQPITPPAGGVQAQGGGWGGGNAGGNAGGSMPIDNNVQMGGNGQQQQGQGGGFGGAPNNGGGQQGQQQGGWGQPNGNQQQQGGQPAQGGGWGQGQQQGGQPAGGQQQGGGSPGWGQGQGGGAPGWGHGG